MSKLLTALIMAGGIALAPAYADTMASGAVPMENAAIQADAPPGKIEPTRPDTTGMACAEHRSTIRAYVVRSRGPKSYDIALSNLETAQCVWADDYTAKYAAAKATRFWDIAETRALYARARNLDKAVLLMVSEIKRYRPSDKFTESEYGLLLDIESSISEAEAVLKQVLATVKKPKP